MIRKTQLKELVSHIVRGVLAEMGPTDLGASTTPVTSTAIATPDVGLSPTTQAKLEREKKNAARDKVKVDQKMLKKVDNDIKSQKATYDLTRRYTRPNLKKQVDAEKKAARSL